MNDTAKTKDNYANDYAIPSAFGTGNDALDAAEAPMANPGTNSSFVFEFVSDVFESEESLVVGRSYSVE